MSTRICPVCGADYLDWVQTCSICGVTLVSPAEAPDPLRLPETEQVVYELGVWPLGLQAEAAQAMAESGIPHGWDGTDLVVHLDHEANVDALLAVIEEPGGPAATVVLDEPERDEPDDEADDLEQTDDDLHVDDEGEGAGADGSGELEYALDEWSDEDRVELTRRLDAGGVPHRWETAELLVVALSDEALVEEMLDEVEFPDALEPETEDEDDETTFLLMSELFVAADRLKGNPRDPDGIQGLATVVETADPAQPPYGVDGDLWVRALAAADDLADRLAGEGDADADGLADDEMDDAGEPVFVDDDLAARAGALRDLLRPYV